MKFSELGLSPKVHQKLEAQGLINPTPIQEQAIPLALAGRDVLGLAQTGTGKTAAFGLPLIDQLLARGTAPQPKTATSLILAPTRELAKQIAENLAPFTGNSHLRQSVIVGGMSINRQIERAKRGVDIMIATPGRLIDLLDRRAVRLDKTEFLVLDEADQMLDMGFIHALRRIAPLLPKDRQTMMFSATMPKLMADLSAQFLDDPERIEVARPGVAAENITQAVHFVTKENKAPLLSKLMTPHKDERTLVFARTKHGAERLMKKLRGEGFKATSIHGNKSQGQRDRALKEFKAGNNTILVATDVAARGIDIPQVMYVYNFDLPNVPENYVHRIGRTARAGASGQAIAFCAPDEMKELRAIEKVLKTKIEVIGEVPQSYTARPEQEKQQSRPKGGRPPKRGAKPSTGSARRRNKRRKNSRDRKAVNA